MLRSEEDSRCSWFYNTHYKVYLWSFYFGLHRWSSADLTTELILTITSHECPNNDRLHTSDQILPPPPRPLQIHYWKWCRFTEIQCQWIGIFSSKYPNLVRKFLTQFFWPTQNLEGKNQNHRAGRHFPSHHNNNFDVFSLFLSWWWPISWPAVESRVHVFLYWGTRSCNKLGHFNSC